MGANWARVIHQSPQTVLSVVVDPDLERATEVAAHHGGRASADLDALGAVDAVVVAAPTDRHVEIAMPLIADQIPVLVEKPMATTCAEVESLCALATAQAVPLMCGFVERFNAVIGTLKVILEGRPLHIVALRHSPRNPTASTSVVWDLLIHDADLVLQVAEPSGEPFVAAQSLVPQDSNTMEIADCLLRFPDGLVATLSASRRSQTKVRSMIIASDTALYELDLLRQDVTVYRHLRAEFLMGNGPRYRSETAIEVPFVRHAGEPLALELSHFVDLVEGRVDRHRELASIAAPHRIAERVATA
jgi:predicted dehydrogenase